jgi:metallo-beta-lactamase class B
MIALLLLVASPSPDAAKVCENCNSWNRPHAPVHVFGNTWWVGVDGLSVVAIDTGAGVVLFDGALPQSVPNINASLASAGLKLSQVKLIASSHVHYDHAGGIAALQRDSGATVLASPPSAQALRAGCPTADDPQAGFGCEVNGFPPVTGPIRELRDEQVVKLGNAELRPHFTPGHTPGSTTWTWKSCEGSRCLNMVYADSLTAVSADGFRFSTIARAFHASIAKVSALPCDVLLSPHPDASETVERLSARDGGRPDPATPGQCEEYARRARAKLDVRLSSESR